MAAKVDFLASSKRQVNQAHIVSLQDNSGGSATDTLAAITGGGSTCENVTKDAIASLAAKVELLTVALENAGISATS